MISNLKLCGQMISTTANSVHLITKPLDKIESIFGFTNSNPKYTFNLAIYTVHYTYYWHLATEPVPDNKQLLW